MTKTEAIRLIDYMLDKWAEILKRLKISPITVSKLIKQINRDTTKAFFVIDTCEYLNHMYNNEYLRVQAALDLLTKEQWAFYDMMEYSDMAEIDVLKKSLKKFQEAWRDRPKFKRSEHVKVKPKPQKI